jgi:hypothetical protein
MKLAFDRDGHKKFRSNQKVKGETATRRAKRALDFLITSEKTVAVAIDGFV